MKLRRCEGLDARKVFAAGAACPGVSFDEFMANHWLSNAFFVLEDEDGRVLTVMALGSVDRVLRTAQVGLFPVEPGHARESLGQLINMAIIQMGFHRLWGSVASDDIETLKAIETLGYRIEGRQISATWKNGAWIDSVLFAVTESEVIPCRT